LIAVTIEKLLHGLQLSFERQRQFTGDAAHELKTSIALLKSSLQLLSMRQRTTAEYEKGLEGLIADVRRMEDLTEQMLTLARLEEESLEPSQVIDLTAVVFSAVQRLQHFADAKRITICNRADESHFAVMQKSDAEILASNLIVNALQHSPGRSILTVSVCLQGDGIGFRVADCGDGIPAAALPHLFERFYRADASRSRQSGGTGLGLAICKAIVERSHGSIVIESELGKGTEVVVTLPAAPISHSDSFKHSSR